MESARSNSDNELTQWQRWSRVGLLLTFTLLTSFQLSQLIWQVTAPATLVLPALTSANQDQPSSTNDINIAAVHLFGEESSKPVVAPVKAVEAPKTRLRLELHGINFSSLDGDSSAIIARKGGKGDFYRIGDKVQGRTILSAVYADRVILDTAGKLETLKFDEARQSGVDVSQSVRRPETTRRNSANTAKRIRDKFKNVRSPEEFASVVEDSLSADPDSVLEGLGLQSLGSGAGYSVTSNSMLRQAGLKVGDKVLSINGQMLGDAEIDRLVVQQVMEQGQASIVVERGNRRLTLKQNFGSGN